MVWPAQPVQVPIAQCSQPVQLRQHGCDSQLGQVFQRFQVQDTEAHVRQLPDGHECVRHARVTVLPVSGVLRY